MKEKMKPVGNEITEVITIAPDQPEYNLVKEILDIRKQHERKIVQHIGTEMKLREALVAATDHIDAIGTKANADFFRKALSNHPYQETDEYVDSVLVQTGPLLKHMQKEKEYLDQYEAHMNNLEWHPICNYVPPVSTDIPVVVKYSEGKEAYMLTGRLNGFYDLLSEETKYRFMKQFEPGYDAMLMQAK